MKKSILEEMSIDDLNQRYRQTFFEYNEKIIWCEGFDSEFGNDGGFKRFITYSEAPNGGLRRYPFESKHVTLRRPPAGWYFNKFAFQLMYLSYTDERQYSRGHTSRNTPQFNTNPGGWNTGGHQRLWGTLEAAYAEVRKPSAPVRATVDQILKLEKLRLNRTVVWNYGSLYYRCNKIAFVDTDVHGAKHLAVSTLSFFPEVKEVLDGITPQNTYNDIPGDLIDY